MKNQSNQFPVKEKTKTKPEPMATSEKAYFIFSNMEKHMPDLYKRLKK